jgi:Uma2 family endonuclease
MVTNEELSVVTPAKQGSWTYNAYAALPNDGHHYEIVNGVLLMAPAPTPDHQSIAVRLTYYLFAHVELGGRGRVFASPIDVELGPKDVFQPDVLVLLNAHLDRIAEKRIIGAPDLVVEVASPGTATIDRLTKYEIYARYGIAEYWIVKPVQRTVEVLVLQNREYRSLGTFQGQQVLSSRILPDLSVRVGQFFV